MLYKEYSHKKKKFKDKELQNEVCYEKKVETFAIKFCKGEENEDDDEHRLLPLYHADCTLDVLVDHSFLKSNVWEFPNPLEFPNKCKPKKNVWQFPDPLEFPNKCKPKKNLDVEYELSKLHLSDEASESIRKGFGKKVKQPILSSKKAKHQVKRCKKERNNVEVLGAEELAVFYCHLRRERHARFQRIIEKYENCGESEIVDLDNSTISTSSGKWRPLRETDLKPAPYICDEKTTAFFKMSWRRLILQLQKGQMNVEVSVTKEKRTRSSFLCNSNEANEPYLSKDFIPEKYSNSQFKDKVSLKNPSKFDNSLYEHSPPLSTSSSDIEFDETLPCHSVRASHISSSQHFNRKTADLYRREYPKGLNNQSFVKKSSDSTRRYSSKDVRNWSEDDLSKSSEQSLSPCSVQAFRSKSGKPASLLSFSPSKGRSFKDKMVPQNDSDESSFLEDPNNSYVKESVLNKTTTKSRKSKNELAYRISKDVRYEVVATVTTKKFDRNFSVENGTDNTNKIGISNENVENNPLNVPRSTRRVRNRSPSHELSSLKNDSKKENDTKKNILKKQTLLEKNSCKSTFETFVPDCNLLESKSSSLRSVKSNICPLTDDSIATQNVSDRLSKEKMVSAIGRELKKLTVKDVKTNNYENVCSGSDSFPAKHVKSFNGTSSHTTENHFSDNSTNSLTSSFIALNLSSKNNCSLKHHSPKNGTCKAKDSKERQNKKRKISSSEFAVMQNSKRINAYKPTLQQSPRNDSKAKKLSDKKHFKHLGLSQELILSDQRPFSKESKDVKAVDSPSDKHLETLIPFPKRCDNLKNKVILDKYSRSYNLKDVSIRLDCSQICDNEQDNNIEFKPGEKSKRMNAYKPTLQQSPRNDSKAKKLSDKKHFKHSGLSQELILSDQRPFSKESKDVKAVDSPSDKHLETLIPFPKRCDNLKNKVILDKYSRSYNLKDVSIRLDCSQICDNEQDNNIEFKPGEKSKRMNAYKPTLQQSPRNDSKAKKLSDKKHFKHSGLSQELILSDQRPFSKESKDVKAVDSPSDKHLETLIPFPKSCDNLKNKVILDKYSRFYNLKDVSIRLERLECSQICGSEQDNNMEFKPGENSVDILSSPWFTKKQNRKNDKIKEGLNCQKAIASDFGGQKGELSIDVLSSPVFNKLNYHF